MFPPTTAGANPNVKPFAFDLEGAKKLLAEAKADGVPVDTGFTLIARTENFPGVIEVMEALQQMLQEAGFNVKLQMVEVATHEQYFSKPYPTDLGPYVLVAQHDNNKGDPSFSMFFKYASEGRQSGVADPRVDQMIADASAATGEDRAAKWADLVAYLHDDVVADALLWHMVGFSRVSKRLNWKPTIATNSQLQLSQIGFK